MSTDNERKENENGVDNAPEEASYTVISELIKAKPLSKRRGFRNSMLVIVLAVIFGLVASVIFFLLEPYVASKWVRSNNDASQTPLFVFTGESPEDEMAPEDMLSLPTGSIVDMNVAGDGDVTAMMNMIADEIEFGINDYKNLYTELAMIAQQSLSFMVRVTAVSTEKDWFNNMFEDVSEMSGLIIAGNESGYYILTYYDYVKGCDIAVTFGNGISARAELLKYDKNTGLCIVSVPYENVNEVTREYITVANLGSSNSINLTGSPVIAIGSPAGIYGSVNYGIITSNGNKMVVADNTYRWFTTDIYGSTKATGVIINLSGSVLGIIDTGTQTSDVVNQTNDSKNLVRAIGISDLKRTVERMINELDTAYLGIMGTDMPNEAFLSYGAPHGAFVLSTVIDSPAMKSGIQSGDIITKIGNMEILTYSDMVSAIISCEPESEIEITVARQALDEYQEITFEVMLSKIK